LYAPCPPCYTPRTRSLGQRAAPALHTRAPNAHVPACRAGVCPVTLTLRPEHGSGPTLQGRAAAQMACLTGPAIDAPHLAGRRHPRRERRAPQRSAPRGRRRPSAAAVAARPHRPSQTPQACRGRRRARSACCSAAWRAPCQPAQPRCACTAAARAVRHAPSCAHRSLVCVPSRRASRQGISANQGHAPHPCTGRSSQSGAARKGLPSPSPPPAPWAGPPPGCPALSPPPAAAPPPAAGSGSPGGRAAPPPSPPPAAPAPPGPAGAPAAEAAWGAPAPAPGGSERRCSCTSACSASRRARSAARRCRRASLSCAANSGVDTYLRAARRRDRAPSPRPCVRPGAAQPARSARRTRTQHGLTGLRGMRAPRHASAAAQQPAVCTRDTRALLGPAAGSCARLGVAGRWTLRLGARNSFARWVSSGRQASQHTRQRRACSAGARVLVRESWQPRWHVRRRLLRALTERERVAEQEQ